MWNELHPTEYAQFKPSISRYISNVTSFNDIVGFMSIFKNNEVVFKTKNLKDKRNNTGAYCENAGKRDIITRLNTLYGTNIYSELEINKDIITIFDIT